MSLAVEDIPAPLGVSYAFLRGSPLPLTCPNPAVTFHTVEMDYVYFDVFPGAVSPS